MKWFLRKFGGCFAVLIMVVLCSYSLPAQAQDTFEFVEITCVPEFDYFALRTTIIPFTPREEISSEVQNSTIKRLESQGQMFTPEALLKQPYECNFPTRKFIVKVDNLYEQHEKGQCTLCTNFGINILVNGEMVTSFLTYGQQSLETHWIEITHLSRLQECVFSDYGNRKTCKMKETQPKKNEN